MAVGSIKHLEGLSILADCLVRKFVAHLPLSGIAHNYQHHVQFIAKSIAKAPTTAPIFMFYVGYLLFPISLSGKYIYVLHAIFFKADVYR